MVNAEVTSGGELSFESQIVGRLQGFRYTPDAAGEAESVKADPADIANALTQEFEVRAARLSEAVDSALVLANDGAIRWLGDPVAKIIAGDALLTPRALILVDETLTEVARQKVQNRLDLWLSAYVHRLLGPLFQLETGAELDGPAKNVATQLVEALGVLERARVAHDVKTLDQNARGMLRKLGVRFGAHYVYVPSLIKPSIRVLAIQLWALRQNGAAIGSGLEEIPQFAASGRTSFHADSTISKETYRVAGFRLCGDRAVRVDILERLADLIRPAIAYRPGPNAGSPPPGAADGDGFVVTGAMTSLTGCSGEQFASVLRSLGFVSERRKGPALTAAQVAPEAASIATGAEDATAVAAGANAEDFAADAPVVGDSGHSEPDEIAPVLPETQLAEAVADNSLDHEITAAQIESPDVVGNAAPAVVEEAGVQHNEAPDHIDAAPAIAQVESGAAVDAESRTVDIPLVDSSDPTGDDKATEELLVEVWRPRPPNRQHRRPAPSEKNVRANAKEAGEGNRRSGTNESAPWRARTRRHGPSPQPAADAAKPQVEDGGRFQSGRRARQFDPVNKIEGAEGQHFGKRHARSADERKQDGRRHETPPAPAPRREAPVNLNSPFAKLLALKTQLETKGKG